MHAYFHHSVLALKGLVQMEMSSREFVFPTHFSSVISSYISLYILSRQKEEWTHRYGIQEMTFPIAFCVFVDFN